MGLALQKSTDGGTTFEQVSVDVADYTDGIIMTTFYTLKDSNNNCYILCRGANGYARKFIIIKFDKFNVKTVAKSANTSSAYYESSDSPSPNPILSRDEKIIFFGGVTSIGVEGRACIYRVDISNISNGISPEIIYTDNGVRPIKFTIYKDQYIWVASSATVKIYNYDTKALLASSTIGSFTYANITVNEDNVCWVSFKGSSATYNRLLRLTFDGISTLTATTIIENSEPTNDFKALVLKQTLIDRFGDIITLTNSGTASKLIKCSSTGEIIDSIALSVGTNKGAYGLQVYSKDNGTKCWVQFSNDLGTWRTEAKSYDATPTNRTFGAVTKIRDNGVTTYGDDHGGDNNYSVRC